MKAAVHQRLNYMQIAAGALERLEKMEAHLAKLAQENVQVQARVTERTWAYVVQGGIGNRLVTPTCIFRASQGEAWRIRRVAINGVANDEVYLYLDSFDPGNFIESCVLDINGRYSDSFANIGFVPQGRELWISAGVGNQTNVRLQIERERVINDEATEVETFALDIPTAHQLKEETLGDYEDTARNVPAEHFNVEEGEGQPPTEHELVGHTGLLPDVNKHLPQFLQEALRTNGGQES